MGSGGEASGLCVGSPVATPSTRVVTTRPDTRAWCRPKITTEQANAARSSAAPWLRKNGVKMPVEGTSVVWKAYQSCIEQVSRARGLVTVVQEIPTVGPW